ncbi:MAG: tripartite tricarboxylate transporter substrate binding protein [Burkholderiales bacterium]|nr:tripartite tricarboxylate transporter substrate binding protein [Burkholderiales bacterium]
MNKAVIVLLASCLAACSAGVAAQNYPQRAVRMVVAYPAGGSIDTVARLVSQRFVSATGQQFLVENRSGAAGIIGTDNVAKAAPDGYTLLMGSAAAIASAPSMYAKLPYDPDRDLAPVVLVANQPNVLLLHPSVPVRNLKEFIALTRAHPGKFNYGSSGIGATQHMTAELFAMMTGTRIVHVPYRGGAPAMIDLMTGQIDFMFTPAPNSIAQLQSGRVRGLAVTSLKRSGILPELPTMDESGLKGFELLGWIGLLAPPGTPQPVIGRLNSEVQKMLAGDLQPRLADLGLDTAGGTPEQFAAFIKKDIAKYAKIVKAANIPLQ